MTPVRTVVFWYVREAKDAARRWRRLRGEPGWEKLTRESSLAKHGVLGPALAGLRGAVKGARIGRDEGGVVEAARVVADGFATEWERRPVETGWLMCSELADAMEALGGVPAPVAEVARADVAEEAPAVEVEVAAAALATEAAGQMGLFA